MVYVGQIDGPHPRQAGGHIGGRARHCDPPSIQHRGIATQLRWRCRLGEVDGKQTSLLVGHESSLAFQRALHCEANILEAGHESGRFGGEIVESYAIGPGRDQQPGPVSRHRHGPTCHVDRSDHLG